MWQMIISFLGGPVISGLLKAYNAHLANQATDEATAANLAAKEVAVQQREIELQTQYKIAELGYWYEPDKIMGYCVAIYFIKLLIWDKVLGLGTTDALCRVGDNCWTGATANIIVMFYFGKRGVENVMRIFVGKK